MDVLAKIAGVPDGNLPAAAETTDPEIDLIVEDLRYLSPDLRRAVKDFVAHLRTNATTYWARSHLVGATDDRARPASWRTRRG